jgi:hypothetical protein
MAALAMAELREAVAAGLAGAPVEVHPGPLDAVAGPCLIVGWGDPWLEPANAATAMAHPAITCVAGRVDAGAGLDALEELVHYAMGAAWHVPMGVERVEGPALTSFGGVDYLTARLILTAPLLLKGN